MVYFNCSNFNTNFNNFFSGWKCARAILPVPEINRNAKETYIAFYFEGHIKGINHRYFIKINNKNNYDQKNGCD